MTNEWLARIILAALLAPPVAFMLGVAWQWFRIAAGWG